jgi:hypothetical protein
VADEKVLIPELVVLMRKTVPNSSSLLDILVMYMEKAG